MDSVNDSFMASTKVSPIQHHQSHQRSSLSSGALQRANEALIIVLSFLFIVLVSLTIATVFLPHMHSRNYNRNTEPTESVRPNAENLKTLCSVTRHPELCFTSISTSIKENETDPDDIFAVSIKIAVDNITSLAPLMGQVLLRSNVPGAESALEHCTGSFTESLKLLKWSLTSVLLGRKENYHRVFPSDVPVDLGTNPLTHDRRREYLMSWLMRAMVALDRCVAVLDEVGCAAVNEFNVKVYRARMQVCNTVDFLLNRDKIMEFSFIHPAEKTD